ncbi:MAG: hypothetical protein CMI15_03110 [Opitutaceae bacterium]|nr:hypothetical protein [Opitutaceae bacterium]
MSLINQALKKEQQRRSLNLREAATDIPVYDSNSAGNGLSLSRQRKNASLSILLGLTGAGVVLLGLGGAFMYFGKAYLSGLTATSPTEGSTEARSMASNPLTSNPVNEILEEIDSTEPAELNDSNARSEEEKTVPGNEVAPENAELTANSDSATITGDSETSDPSVAVDENGELEPGEEIADSAEATPEEPQFEFKIQDFVDEFQVFGFRSAGESSRLLLGGRVFKLNDVVDNERGLIFRGSDGESLIFEAPSGYFYKKPL